MLETYRTQGVTKNAVEAGAPEAMKNTADRMVPFLSYLASELGAEISGYHFRLAADGMIGIWSESQVINEIWHKDGPWTIEDLEMNVPELIRKVQIKKTSINLH